MAVFAQQGEDGWHANSPARSVSGGGWCGSASICRRPPSTSSRFTSTTFSRRRSRDGLSEADARARVMRALDESALSALRRRQPPDSRNPRSFNVASAFRLALRQFRQHPTFALVTVLVLGLGTGAATTVFTIVDAVVLRPLPYDVAGSTGHDVGCQYGEGPRARSDVAGELHGLPGAPRVQGRGGVVASRRQPDRSRDSIRCASTPSR